MNRDSHNEWLFTAGVVMDKTSEKRRSRKTRQIADQRREILEAAEKVFSEKGFVSAKVEEIAHEAAYAVGTLYKLFDSKEELYAALLNQKSAIFQARVDGVLADGGSPREQVERLFRVRVDVFWEERRFFRLFFHQTMNTVCDPRAGFTEEVRARYEAFLPVVEKLFADGIEQGVFRRVSPALLTIAFESLLRGYLVQLSHSESPERHREEEDRMLELFLAGALAPPEPKEST